jgi:microcystin-dependent protein
MKMFLLEMNLDKLIPLEIKILLLENNTTGNQNTFVGHQAGQIGSTTSFNTFVGQLAGQNNTADNNTFIGQSSGLNNTTGSENVFVGKDAGLNNLDGGDNIFIGYNAGSANTEGNNNVFVGQDAGQSNVSGNSNVFVGENSGLNNTANENTFLGRDAGYENTTGANNVFVGNDAGRSVTTTSNSVYVGDSAGATNGDFDNVVVGQNTNATNNNQIILGQDATPTSTEIGLFAKPVRSDDAITPSYPTVHCVDSGNGVTELICTSVPLVPPGVVLPYAGSSSPIGYLLCDGSSYDNTEYANLFAIIGTTYGGSGSNFNVPDMRSRLPMGAGQGTGLSNYPLASTGGQEAITDVPSHTHNITDPGHTHDVPKTVVQNGQNTRIDVDNDGPIDELNLDTSTTTTSLTNTTGITINSTGIDSVDVRNPYLALNYIIKY